MKYSLSPRKILRADLEGYPRAQAIFHQIYQTLSISSTVLPGWAILLELIFYNALRLAAGPIFSSIRSDQLGEYWKV